jgi:hypothetical protein
MRYEVHRTVNMKSMVFYKVMPCSFVGIYEDFGGTCCLHLHGRSLFYSEYGGEIFFRNVATYLPNYTMSHPRRQPYSDHFMLTTDPSLYWESNNRLASLLFWFNPKVHYGVHRNLTLVHITSQITLLHIATPHLSKTHFNIILTSTLRFLSYRIITIWLHDIWGFHDSENSYCGHMGRNAVWSHGAVAPVRAMFFRFSYYGLSVRVPLPDGTLSPPSLALIGLTSPVLYTHIPIWLYFYPEDRRSR